MADLGRLGGRPEIGEVLASARRYPTSQIYLAAYADESDARARALSVQALSDEMVIDVARYLAGRGIAAERISGKGLGANASVGRTVIVSLDVAPPGPGSDRSARQVAEAEAQEASPERFPRENISFKEIAGTAEYRVGPRDVLRITNYLTSGPVQYTVTVSAAGTITFDLVRDVPVAGLTLTEIESLLGNVLQRFYRNPRFGVEVATYASRTITLVGPTGARSVTLVGRTTLLDLLAREQVQATGGLPGGAAVGLPDLKSIRIVRGRREFQANVFRIVVDKDWKENIVLDDGDIVYLAAFSESGNLVMVLGAVNNPGVYPVPRSMTAVQALYVAGGPTYAAYIPHARIIRGGLKNAQIIPADIDLVTQKGQTEATKLLQPGDILYVPATRIANWNQFLGEITPTVNLLTLPFQGYFLARTLFGATTTTIVVATPAPLLPTP